MSSLGGHAYRSKKSIIRTAMALDNTENRDLNARTELLNENFFNSERPLNYSRNDGRWFA